jgi:hypothetical protein
MTQQFDNDRSAGEPAVDSHETIVRPREHGLALGPRQTGRGDEPEELALQPAVATACDVAPLEHIEKRWDPVAALGSKRGDAAMQEVLGREAVAQCPVECRGQRLGRRGAGEVDERAGRAGDGDVLDRLPVERRKVS